VILDQLDLAAARPRQVREASVGAVLARLRGGTAGSQRRRLLVSALAVALAPKVNGELLEMAGHAARLVDAGARLDHYGRWSESASLATTADLDGFTHADLATIAAILLSAGAVAVPARLRRESGLPRARIEVAGTLLALADDIDRRLPPARGAAVGALGRDGRLDVTGMPPMLLPSALSERCRLVLRREVRELGDIGHSRAGRRRPVVAVEFK
jgi:exopolyphosphatase/pppGpp-phosphohydrolase